jgi:hypothetical protein
MSESTRTDAAAAPQRIPFGGQAIALAFPVIGGLFLAYGMWRFVVLASPEFTDARLSLVAWGLLLVAASTIAVTTLALGPRMPRNTALGVYIALAVALMADIWNTRGPEPQSVPTASVAVGAVLAGMTLTRPLREQQAATIVLASLFAAVVATTERADLYSIGSDVLLLLIMAGPPLACIVAARGYLRALRLAAERARVQYAVVTDTHSLGIHDSEELIQLDARAELLLKAVAEGRLTLPLDDTAAAEASDVASRMRQHLVSDRTYTWLDSAIADSPFLVDRVRIRDPGTLATALKHGQRDGLLTAIWLFVAAGRRDSTLEVILSEIEAARGSSTAARTVEVMLRARGIGPARIDPNTWQALERVGRALPGVRGGDFQVTIQCVVGRE